MQRPTTTNAKNDSALLLPPKLRDRLRAAIFEEGEQAVCDRLSIGHTAISRLVAGLPSRRGNVKLVTLLLGAEPAR